jgi:hypothetical protein
MTRGGESDPALPGITSRQRPTGLVTTGEIEQHPSPVKPALIFRSANATEPFSAPATPVAATRPIIMPGKHQPREGQRQQLNEAPTPYIALHQGG